jgi:hypothetical protein
MQGGEALAATVGAAQSLAVDSDRLVPPETPVERLGEFAQGRFEGVRLQSSKDRAEGVVARDTVRKVQYLPQQGFLGMAKLLHLRAVLRATQRRCQGDEDNVQNMVLRVARSGIFDLREHAFELAHRCLPPWRADTLRIHFSTSCNSSIFPYAIPLPAGVGAARARIACTTRQSNPRTYGGLRAAGVSLCGPGVSNRQYRNCRYRDDDRRPDEPPCEQAGLPIPILAHRACWRLDVILF